MLKNWENMEKNLAEKLKKPRFFFEIFSLKPGRTGREFQKPVWPEKKKMFSTEKLQVLNGAHFKAIFCRENMITNRNTIQKAHVYWRFFLAIGSSSWSSPIARFLLSVTSSSSNS